MSQSRTFLLIAWLMLAYLLWEAWSRPQSVETPAQSAQTADVPAAVTTTASSEEVPLASASGSAAPAVESTDVVATDVSMVTLSNDVLRLQISTQGGNIVRGE